MSHFPPANELSEEGSYTAVVREAHTCLSINVIGVPDTHIQRYSPVEPFMASQPKAIHPKKSYDFPLQGVTHYSFTSDAVTKYSDLKQLNKQNNNNEKSKN